MTCNKKLQALIAAVPLLLLSTIVSAQSNVKVIYSFAGVPDGRGAYGGVVADQAGNLYGTTAQGGTYDCGTVYKLDSTTGQETIFHSFNCQDGFYPWDGVYRDAAGNLYGTTWEGGTSNVGTVFKVDASGNFTLLHSFSGPDGDSPYSNVIGDAAGNLYGTTTGGGAYGDGTVFRIDQAGNETVIYSFSGPDGAAPDAGLIQDSEGNFYGTTTDGGDFGFGTVFRLGRDGTETVLYSFKGNPDGQAPSCSLIRDKAGNFYGTTGIGGGSYDGTVFKLDTHENETVLHSFQGSPDGQSSFAGLIRDSAGSLYGTTEYGGLSGSGTVFKIDPTGKETVYSFTGTSVANPYSGLLRRGGSFFGTSSNGGAYGQGAIYKITP